MKERAFFISSWQYKICRQILREQELRESSRRNGINSRSDLSHHRTCRSAYGGSLINL